MARQWKCEACDEKESPDCDGCDLCYECCECAPTDCNCDTCKLRRGEVGGEP